MNDNFYTELSNTEKNPFISALVDAGISPHDQHKIVYKYVSVSTAKIIMENCSMRFSSPLIFNDPFEINLGFLDYSYSREELTERLENILRKQNRILTAKERRLLADKISNDDFIDPYLKAFEIQKKRSLILCTSRTCLSTLMWSHYADNHKGVCLGFFMPAIYPDLNMFTFNVNYVDKIIPFKVIGGSDQERSITLYTWFNTKSKIWAYENEVRTIIPNLDEEFKSSETLYSDIPLDPIQFREIYFGVGTSAQHISELQGLIAKKKYPIERLGKMEISRDTFDLDLKVF